MGMENFLDGAIAALFCKRSDLELLNSTSRMDVRGIIVKLLDFPSGPVVLAPVESLDGDEHDGLLVSLARPNGQAQTSIKVPVSSLLDLNITCRYWILKPHSNPNLT